MNSSAVLRFPVFLSLPFVVATISFAQTPAPPRSTAPSSSYGSLPLLFEANQGQTDPSVQFLSHGQGYTLFLRQGEAVLALHSAAPKNNPGTNSISRTGTPSPETSVVQMQLVGSNPRSEVVQEDPQITRTNYFYGKDPNQWRTGIPNYGRIRYRSIYDGIDQVYYGNQRRLEHDFVVSPNADPGKIVLALEGAKNLRIDTATGDLIVDTGHGDLRLQKPIAYQQEPNHPRNTIPSSYKLLAENRIAFTLGSYDRSRPLIIDPVLVYSTYLGGSGNNGNGDQGNGIAVDASGDAYIVGTAYSTNFPVNAGAYQTQDNAATGNSTVFVSELNAAGTALIYSTYLGGSGGDFGYGIGLDAANNAYITGATYSTDFPVTCGALQLNNPSTTAGAPTAFVASLKSDGAVLLYSTYLGGEGNTSTTTAQGDVAQAIAVNPAGNAYVTGYTFSPNFPVTDQAFQQTFAGSAALSNAFVTELNLTGTALVYSTYLGGSGAAGGGDYGNGIALDSSGDAFIAGSTGSANFPVTPGAFQATLNGPSNAFVTKLNPAGSSQLYSTYLGGAGVPYSFYYEGAPFKSEYTESSGDSAQAIALDGQGNAYVAGITSSNNFPLTTGTLEGTGTGLDAYVGPAPYAGQDTDAVYSFPPVAFVTKLNQDGSALDYSTFLEGQSTAVKGLAVDGTGHAYIAGSAPTLLSGAFGGFQSTPDALPVPASTGSSAFLVKLDPAATVLNYATLLGGSSNDGANALALDSAGNVYLTGFATSTDFPATAGAFQTKFGQPSSTPIPTTMSLVSQQFLCDVQVPGFTVVANLMVNSNSNGPAPTGTVAFTGAFEVGEYAEPVAPGAGGTAAIQVIGTSSADVQQSASWEADYSGDSVYAPSSLTGTATGPGNCDSQPYVGTRSQAKTAAPRPSAASRAVRTRTTSLSNTVMANETVRSADASGTSNAFVSKFALASESNTTTYPALAIPGTPIPTTLSVISSQASWAGLGDCADFGATFVLGLTTGVDGPPPTGDVQLYGPWEAYYDYPMTGSWGPMSQVTVGGAGQFFGGAGGGVSVQAIYLGDSIYQGSSVLGYAPLPYCDPGSPYDRGSSGKPQKPQGHIQFRIQPAGTPSAQAAGGAPAGKPISNVASTVHGPKFTPPPANPRKMSSIRPADSSATCLAPAVATPVFSLAAGTYNGTQTVSITDATVGATIYYTTDGSRPSASSTPYTVPIAVTATETIEAIAVAPLATQLANSPVAVGLYTIEYPAAAPTFSPVAGTYTTIQTVTISDTTPAAAIYYTTDGSTPSASSTPYTTPISVAATQTIQAIAIATGYTNSTVASSAYIINLPLAATPTFSPAAGTYTTAQSVSITDTTPGATIYYTTNGTTPTAASTVYSTAIPVSSTETIQAIAIATGYTNSAVASATYNITPPAATPTFSPAGGTYATAQSVTITDTTPGAAIYYTTDGTVPSASSTLYTAPIEVNVSETIEAVAIAAGYSNSYAERALYTINSTVVFNLIALGASTTTTVTAIIPVNTTLGSIDVLTQGAANQDFTNAGGGTCTVGTAYSANTTCTVNVTFTPKFPGVRYGALVLRDTNGAEITSVYIESSAVGPQAAFLPGTETTITSGLNQPGGLVLDGSGNLYIAETTTGRVLKETWSAGSYSESTLFSGLNAPGGLAVDGRGNLYIADTGNNRVLKETLLGGSYTQSTVAADLNKPSGVAVGNDGSVYIADAYNGRVLKETLSDGNYIESTVVTCGTVGIQSCPSSVAVDSIGYLYVTSYDSTQVLEFDVNGGIYQGGIMIGSGLNRPSSIVIDGRNNLYIADTLNNRIVKEAVLHGVYVQSIVSSSSLNMPGAVAVDPGGNAYISDSSNKRVLKEDIADPPSLSFASTGYGSTSSDSPQAVTVYNSGSAVLGIRGVEYPADFPEDSSATGDCKANLSLSEGDTCTLTIDFKPVKASGGSATAPLAEEVKLGSNTLFAYALQDIPVNGTGTAPAAAAPAFSPAAGTYNTIQTVTITDTTPGATIHYTTDGSTPSASSTPYTAPISVGVTETIQAIAIATNYVNSPVASAAYTIDLSAAATPTFSPAAGTYTSAQSVTIADTTPGAVIHYTTDGTIPTAASTAYTSAIPVSSTETVH
ncbi:MAG TPA: chitobiase/beta-hexosaminidase C-terminal domain-containing protein, partial [Acidobacteriaceae bacterium]|nr:chitobiase/beta-hexosaminidase C-terminal domain-containing protein [Acidobacteriaceae bacterium]